ncbi:MAG: translocation/assembly module TamB [Candidatus Omnitrophica bacterium]|nr:translocation/assembly module TamB [Candidatus Omnitrophota bacterium]
MFAKKHKVLIFFTIITCIAGVAVYYLIFTTKGSSFITRTVLSNYVDSESVDIKKIEGSLAQTLVFQDIEFNNLKWLPQGSNLKIQKLEVYLGSFSIKGLNLKIFNGRLNFSGSDVILFYGNYQDAALDFTVYSNVVGVYETLDFFAKSSELKNLSGTLRNVDIKIKGSFLEPELSGEFQIEKLSQKAFTMKNCPGSLNLQLKDIKNNLKLYGEILLNKGELFGPKTAIINLEESKIIFSGEPKKPTFNLKGTSKVGDTKINIGLKGNIDQPDLKLTSQPPLPQEQLLVMLATNKTWQGAGSAIKKGELSADLAKDFLDYFVFSGSGHKIAEKFGLSDISVKFDKETKGIGATKDISDKTSASYSIEQPQNKEQKSATTHKVGAEYKITDSISLGAEKELKQDNETGQVQEKQKTDDKVFLKFKKEF